MVDKFYMFMVKTLLGNFVHSYMLISPPKCAVYVFLFARNSGGIHFCQKTHTKLPKSKMADTFYILTAKTFVGNLDCLV